MMSNLNRSECIQGYCEKDDAQLDLPPLFKAYEYVYYAM
jgi:hypothetical protein